MAASCRFASAWRRASLAWPSSASVASACRAISGSTIRARTSPRRTVEPSRTSTSDTWPPVSVERTASRKDFTVPAETAAVISSTRPSRTRKTSTGIVPEIL